MLSNEEAKSGGPDTLFCQQLFEACYQTILLPRILYFSLRWQLIALEDTQHVLENQNDHRQILLMYPTSNLTLMYGF